MAEPSSYDINQQPIDYTSRDSHSRAAVIGMLNTLLVAVVGCFLATVFGVIAGVLRLSKNWIVRKLMTVYVEGRPQHSGADPDPAGLGPDHRGRCRSPAPSAARMRKPRCFSMPSPITGARHLLPAAGLAGRVVDHSRRTGRRDRGRRGLGPLGHAAPAGHRADLSRAAGQDRPDRRPAPARLLRPPGCR